MTDSDPTPPDATPPGEAAPAARRRRRWPWVAAVLLVVLAVAGGGGVAAWPWIARMMEPPPAGPTVADLATEIATLNDQMAALRLRLGQVEARRPDLAKGESGLEPRVAALEAALAARPDSRLAGEVKAQGDRLAAVEKTAADAATVLRLVDRIDKVEAAVHDLQARHGSAGALLLAVGQLRQAVDMALPFDAELRIVVALAPKPAEAAALVAPLRPRAAAGIPGRPALVARFTTLEPAIVRAEILPEGDGWWPRTLARLAALVSVRREDGDAEGQSAAAVAARVEARLAEGDLAAAVAEAGGLSGGPATVAAPWLDDARARLAADQALSQLAALAAAAAGSGP